MKKETLEKRISANLLTKTGMVISKYQPVLDLLRHPNILLRPTRYERRSDRIFIVDKSFDIIEGLTLLKIDYERGNDARGNVEGDYIKLTKKGKQQVRDYAKNSTF